jgi:hypothetical protein
MSQKEASKLLRAVDDMDGVRYRLQALLMMAEALHGGDEGNAFASVAHDALCRLESAKENVESVRDAPELGRVA